MGELQCPVHDCDRFGDREEVFSHFITHRLYEQKYTILQFIDEYEPEVLSLSDSNDPFDSTVREQYSPVVNQHPIFDMEMIEAYFGSIESAIGESRSKTRDIDYYPLTPIEEREQRESLINITNYDREEYGLNWPKQRQLALERDDFTCRVCGIDYRERGSRIQVHHITPVREFHDSLDEDVDYEKMNELTNLVTLCAKCHGTYGGKWTDTDHKEFVEKCYS